MTEIISLAVDGNRNVYLAGGFGGMADFEPDANGTNPASSLTAVGAMNGFLAKFGECITISTVLISIAGAVVWTGCSSTDWNTPANWSGGTVPLATDDVVIPSTTATTNNQPVVAASTSALAKSVEVQGRASLSIASMGDLPSLTQKLWMMESQPLFTTLVQCGTAGR